VGAELHAALRTVEQADGPDLSAGDRVDQFELIRELGRGGMGTVFLARDTQLGRKVALKFLAFRSPELTARFLTEAKATAQCQHENIVVIHQVGAEPPYLALEYLEGGTLASLLGPESMPPARVLEILLPVARALAVAHERGIVHRDLKPENIFVTQDGRVKVLDFGIAKLASSSVQTGLQHVSGADVFGTQAGTMMGTLSYMAPEQWSDTEVDHRSDLWALGLIGWRLAAGRHPAPSWSESDLRAFATSLDTSVPRLESVVTDASSELSNVLEQCLEKRRDNRIGSALELIRALETLKGTKEKRSSTSPYPGLAAFSEDDGDRFFGRSNDVAKVVRRLEEIPLIAVVGPSGVGKSSFVQAGVVPALKRRHGWRALRVRPGRDPLGNLGRLLSTE
ncbi:MAG: serine/threonine-protein kinase, partial [Myxococcota bacterium]